jgi:hypothetical protein
MLTNITAGPKSTVRPSKGSWDNSHFDPTSSLFRPDEFWAIVASDVGILAFFAGAYAAAQHLGWPTVMWAYFMPVMWVNHFIGMSAARLTEPVALAVLWHCDCELTSCSDDHLLAPYLAGAAQVHPRGLDIHARRPRHCRPRSRLSAAPSLPSYRRPACSAPSFPVSRLLSLFFSLTGYHITCA